jgi:subtilisin family serine protease
MRRVKLPRGMTVAQAIARFAKDPEVEIVEPNYVRYITSTVIPDDTYFATQWGLHNTGQAIFDPVNPGTQDVLLNDHSFASSATGTSGADIRAAEAWSLTTGSSSIVVAVVDTGVDYYHSSLSANIWSNPGETCSGGGDGDGDGYANDCRGWNFVNDNNDPMDFAGHGTHCAGIIGARSNDGKGTAGVNWNVSIMPVKAFNSLGFGLGSDIIAGINYATMKHANIINASFGGDDNSALELQAIQAFIASGGIFVAAAGNSAQNVDVTPTYPAAWSATTPGIITVAATYMDDSLAFFSNYGTSSVQVAAPGVDIMSTYTIPTGQAQNPGNYFWLGPVWPGGVPYGNSGMSIPWSFGGTNNHWSYPPPTQQKNGQTYYTYGSSLYSNCSGYTGNPQNVCTPVNYTANTDSYAVSGKIDLSGKYACTLGLLTTAVDLAPGDAFNIWLSSDNTNWALAQVLTLSDGYAIDASNYDNGQLYVKLELVAGPSSPGAAGVQNARLYILYTTPPFTGDNYQFDHGTSMAAPFVAGLAALVKAQAPALTNTQVIQIINETVDQNPGLPPYVATGGRVNAYRAVGSASLDIPSSLSGNFLSGAISLTWTQIRGTTTGYSVERATALDGPYSEIGTTPWATYEDSTITAGNTYYYRVRASNTFARSLPSTPVAVAAKGSGGGGGGGCFIATAAYGSYLEPRVMVLRHFRDRRLLPWWGGRLFVKEYYRCSPPVAEFIRTHEGLRAVARWALTPLVYGVSYPAASCLLLLFGIGMMFALRLRHIMAGNRRTPLQESITISHLAHRSVGPG